jgi:DNA-binding GntR family transcriptional regulator
MLQPATYPEADPRSQASLAYLRIRADILSGRFAPDDRLKIVELAAALEVSPGAVREALSRLVPHQLVVSQDQKGFAVAPVSIEDLLDLTDVRCEIEAAALRRAVARGDDAWEGAIVSAAHRLTKAERDKVSAAEWRDRHREFHAALVAACGSRRLLALHEQLYEQSERYRTLSSRFDAGRDVPAEHRALVEAALARDADTLVRVMVEHIRTTTALIVDAARSGAAAAEPTATNPE